MTARAPAKAKAKTPAKKAPAKKRAVGKSPQSRPQPSVRKAKAAGKAKAKTVADRAGKVARANGAEGAGSNGRLSKYQIALRDTAIMARIAEGKTHTSIAKEWGISIRAVGQVVERWAEGVPSLDREPMEIVEWLARMHLRQIGDLEVMATRNAERNPNVALGAKRASGEAMLRYMDLMSAVGKLPENLELFRAESVLRRLADEMVETMERVQAGDMEVADAVVFFRGLTGTTAAPVALSEQLPEVV